MFDCPNRIFVNISICYLYNKVINPFLLYFYIIYKSIYIQYSYIHNIFIYLCIYYLYIIYNIYFIYKDRQIDIVYNIFLKLQKKGCLNFGKNHNHHLIFISLTHKSFTSFVDILLHIGKSVKI